VAGISQAAEKHRSKASGQRYLVAISLPELAQHNTEGFTTYARQVRERIHEMCNTFGAQVPVYLVFTADLLGGFAQFFQDADDEERARVWGVTLSAEQGKGFDIATATAQQFEMLYRGLVQMGEAAGAASAARSARRTLLSPSSFMA
jgi:type VI secretion system protein ImpL